MTVPAAASRRWRFPTGGSCRPAARCSARGTRPTASSSTSSAWRVEPSYVADPGEISWGLVDGVHVGDELPWMTDAERADAERIERAFAALAADVDPDDPWSSPRRGARSTR